MCTDLCAYCGGAGAGIMAYRVCFRWNCTGFTVASYADLGCERNWCGESLGTRLDLLQVREIDCSWFRLLK